MTLSNLRITTTIRQRTAKRIRLRRLSFIRRWSFISQHSRSFVRPSVNSSDGSMLLGIGFAVRTERSGNAPTPQPHRSALPSRTDDQRRTNSTMITITIMRPRPPPMYMATFYPIGPEGQVHRAVGAVSRTQVATLAGPSSCSF